MSAGALQRIALGNGFKPEKWHLQLADQLAKRMSENRAAMTVFGIFGTAILRPGLPDIGEFAGELYLVPATADKLTLAEPFLPDLAKVLGVVVHVARPLFKSKGGAAVVQGNTVDQAFVRECRRRIERLKTKGLNTGVQQ